MLSILYCFFFSSRRRHTRWTGDWSSDVCSSDLDGAADHEPERVEAGLLDQQELVDGQVRGEEAPLHLGEALAAVHGHALCRGRVIAHRSATGFATGPSLSVGATTSSAPCSLRSVIAVPRMWKVTIRSVRERPLLSISRSSSLWSTETPTTPAAPTASASWVRRPSATSRASYTACVKSCSSWFWRLAKMPVCARRVERPGTT